MSTQTPRVQPLQLQAGDVTLSGLLAQPVAGPSRGLIVALHGGGYRASYWHSPLLPDASLLTLGASLGYIVLALDRPGYGDSFGIARERQTVASQAQIVFDALDGWLARQGSQPVFLIGHSLGAILSLSMAAHPRAALLSAVDVSGVPLHYPPEMAAHTGPEVVRQMQAMSHLPLSGPAQVRQMFFGPDGSFDPVVFDASLACVPVPVPDFIDAAANPVQLPPQLARIKVPVQWTVPEFEASSLGGQAILDEARSLLRASRRVVTALQPGSGHNISQHHVARAYHLRALAFFDETIRLG